MNISLDYDDTFTADPVLWSRFIKLAEQLEHTIYCITARRDTEENISEMNSVFGHYDIKIPIIFCNLNSKLKEMEKRGIKIHIWIDDSPFAIVSGY